MSVRITCCREVQFDAGHRLLGHESKCAHLHGHRYRVELHAEAQQDHLGRVIDFSVLKERIGGWIDDNLDHGFILNNQDHVAISAIDLVQPVKRYLMSGNPTAENLAALLLDQANHLLADTIVEVYKVVVWETPNCKATAERRE